MPGHRAVCEGPDVDRCWLFWRISCNMRSYHAQSRIEAGTRVSCVRCGNQEWNFSTPIFIGWPVRRDSNPRHLVSKTRTLPLSYGPRLVEDGGVEPHPHRCRTWFSRPVAGLPGCIIFRSWCRLLESNQVPRLFRPVLNDHTSSVGLFGAS